MNPCLNKSLQNDGYLFGSNSIFEKGEKTGCRINVVEDGVEEADAGGSPLCLYTLEP